jgi:hypothetical protein
MEPADALFEQHLSSHPMAVPSQVRLKDSSTLLSPFRNQSLHPAV